MDEGNRTDMVDYYSMASILCVTSVFEGWPLVLNEAMSYGTVPVVFNTLRALSDIVDNQINGFVEREHNEEFADAVCRLASYEALRQRMLRQAAESVTRYRVKQ